MLRGKKSILWISSVCLLMVLIATRGGQSQTTPGGDKADPWKPKELKILVPFAPGGGGDVTSRLLAPYLSKEVGRPVIVENVTGGNSLTGTLHYLKNVPRTGETILRSIEVHMSGGRLRSGQFSYDDFALLASDLPTAIGLFVKADAPWKTFQEMLADIRANPGKISISYLPGTAMHLALEVMVDVLKINVIKVPYGGGGPQRTALLGGHHHAASSGFETTLGIVGDKARPILIFDAERHEWRKDVPTLEEIAGRKVPYPAMRYGWLVHREVKDKHPNRYAFLVESLKKALNNPEHAKLTLEAERRLGYLGPEEGTKALKSLAELADQYKSILGK
jgi:tripartite-type tricarboxylate transporter receptor subunit TctC